MAPWARKLSPEGYVTADIDDLGDDGAVVRAELGDDVARWAVQVGTRIATRITREIPVLGDTTPHFDALRVATTSTTLRALTMVAGLSTSSSLSSPEETEISADFARRGLALSDLLRSIRVGYAVLAAALLDGAAEHATDPSAELRRVSVLLFEAMDEFTTEATTSFIRARDSWAASVSAARLEMVQRILDGQPIAPEQAEALLAYPLAGNHLAFIAWTDPRLGLTERDLRATVEELAACWGTPTHELVIPVGAHTVWAWARINTPHARRRPLPHPEGLHVAVGQLDSGPEGFVRSHREARSIELLLGLRPDGTPDAATHADLDLHALVLADPPAAKRFVARHLGPLADDEARMSELRTTLSHYLDADRSISAVAAQENISRNTVTYRVQQALNACGHPAGEPTTRLRVALMIREWIPDSSPDR